MHGFRQHFVQDSEPLCRQRSGHDADAGDVAARAAEARHKAESEEDEMERQRRARLPRFGSGFTLHIPGPPYRVERFETFLNAKRLKKSLAARASIINRAGGRGRARCWEN